ncbi:MAG TPA: transketolase [Pseudomonadota bacterium]|nr:transketolase [Pseudomonadota bacterium]HNK45672.1 transketolase [Pseudomonadota bacterium]
MTPLAPSLDTLQILARRIRRYSILATTKAGSGHPSSSISAAELMTALFFTALRYDFSDPKRLDNDRFVLSKGHAAPVLYAAWAAAGLISEADLLSLRRLDSIYEGHPTPRIPWIDVATGSLGQGLPNAIGMAAFLKNVVGSPARVWALCGDGEMAEGSNWEAAPIAAELGLSNLTAIVDVNRLEQSVATRLGWDMDRYASQFEVFGWETLVIDGQDLPACVRAMAHASHSGGSRPLAILARTQKGAGVSFMADHDGWHGKPMDEAHATRALAELGADDPSVIGKIAKPSGTPRRAPHLERGLTDVAALSFPADKTIATRKAFGEALKRLGDQNPSVMVLDADVKNSTFTEQFEKAHPDRFVQCFIAEQAMVGLAAGAGAISAVPWVATFAAFLSRAYDQIRMAALSSSNLKVCGSHAGVSIGEDGASQMGLEDLAMFRAVHGSTVVYPADPYATVALVDALSAMHGVAYLRATRGATPVLYSPTEKFPIGGSKTLRQSASDVCVVVAAGITLHEAIKAADQLQSEGIAIRVVDAYSVKPIDADGLRAAAQAGQNRVIVVEDHWIEGGLGDAVLEVFAESGSVRVRKLAVCELPHSGKPEELLDLYGLSARKIAQAVRAFCK